VWAQLRSLPTRHRRPRKPRGWSRPPELKIGSLDASLGKLEEARKILEALEKEWPDFLEVHVRLATVYLRTGLKEKSQQERDIVLQLNQKARETGPRPDR
jgi:tetratricopeptide (TPR) repeat protein